MILKEGESTVASSDAGIDGQVLVLIESSGGHEKLDSLRLESFLESIIEEVPSSAGTGGIVSDAALSLDSNQETVSFKTAQV